MKFYMEKKSKLFILPVLFGLVFIMSLALGAVKISPLDVFKCLIQGGTDTQASIVRLVRVPRSLGAGAVGIFLSLAGLSLQTVLNNSIAGPSVIGINGGAAFFALVSMIFLPSVMWATPVFGFFGAVISTLLVYKIAAFAGGKKLTLVLSGVAVSSLFGALSDTLLTFFPAASVGRTAFSIGGLGSINIEVLKWSLFVGTVGVIGIFFLKGSLNVLSLGDDSARSLGINVKKVRFLSVFLCAMLVGAAISIGGLISFVGLICPHMARQLFGHNIKLLVPQTAFLGGTLVLLCDILARTMFAPFEIPVGIFLSFLGAPFFIWLLLYKNRGEADD